MSYTESEKNKLRKELKNNFLKRLIFRIDFSGLMNTDVEKYIERIRPAILERGYKKFGIENTNSISVDIADPNDIKSSNEIQKVFVFDSEDKKRISVSTNFIDINIDMENSETMFYKYLPLISTMVNNLKKLDFVFFERIGLRKINSCVILDTKSINNYFKNNVFCKFANESFNNAVADVFIYKGNSVESYKTNYKRELQMGEVIENGNRQSAQQVILDIDCYIDNKLTFNELIRSVDSKDILREFNDKIYEIYINSLQDDFIDLLKNEEFNDKDVRGVIKNV